MALLIKSIESIYWQKNDNNSNIDSPSNVYTYQDGETVN